MEAAPALSISIDVPGSGRGLSEMRDFLGEMMRVELTTLEPETPLIYRGNLRIVPGASFGTAYASGIASARTTELLKDGADELMLVMPDVGMTIQTPGRDDIVIEGGEAVLLSQARAMRIVHHEAGGAWAMRVGHRDMAALVPGLASAPAMALRRDTPMLSLLGHYGRMLEAEPLAGEAAQQMAGRQLLDMMSLVVGASRDYREHVERSSLAAVRLASVQADIAANLGDTNLRLEAVALRHGITPRHLQRLLAAEGQTFTDALRQARAGRARAMLEDARNAGRTVLSIALECGFSEASALNRAFRQIYGLAPGDVRRR